MAATTIEFPASWDTDSLNVALSAALRANNAEARAKDMAFARTAVAFAGAKSLGWFSGDKTEDKDARAKFAKSVGLSSCSDTMAKRYVAFADAYAKGVVPNSAEDLLLRKSGVMSALAGKISEADSVDMAVLEDMIVDSAPTNAALRTIAKDRFKQDVAESPEGAAKRKRDSEPKIEDVKGAVAGLKRHSATLAKFMGTLSIEQLDEVRDALESLGDAVAKRTKQNARKAS